MSSELKIEDGGPAFPVADTVHPNGAIQPGTYGMTLRDWFAGQALVGILGSTHHVKINGVPADSADDYVEISYALADAMLERRKK